ncbi:pleiotropic drug resistance protein PDR [Punctularia strigosozonata HHB-11173 SS5]|uniref:pleiotropic drug resistance protein PDR n=1 Tax=Punctularia strigosozonata (strain HHB-11173) TaxID=741275 RepID=UPI0004417610|nr:pleiotropic drug resistance protein PDR [Punctularia strigosozonata HHB-11173 SS5]EIN06105.1 pleiotropic drug resistance protein PDR [Punctularia strigosozonata HHB-11173 SS5]
MGFHSSTSPRPERIHIDEQSRQNVTELARQISRTSNAGVPRRRDTAPHTQPLSPAASRSSNAKGEDLPNPFIGSDDPRLLPGSGSFDVKAWIRAVLNIVEREPERFPQRTAGISFKNLSAYGFGTSTDYQKDVGNIWLEGAGLVRKVLGRERQRKIDILRNFDGLVKSGETLVVLGRPGSGCSTFLKTIAGQTHGFFLSPETEIHYSGIPREQYIKHFRGEVIYQAEVDVHFPMLTVGETLAFAALARAPHNRPDGVTRRQWAMHMRDVVMTIFGLSHTVNTRVGNDYIRGVSGGERKRVSIAEATLSGSPVQCWDNSTRGLDSATALEFVKTLRTASEAGGVANIVAIYQASQEAYDLFDKVILLYEGRQIFFGPTKAAKDYFIRMGYECPPRQTTADFLTSITSPEERIVRAGFEGRVPRTPDEFAVAWKQSAEHAHLMREIEAYDHQYPVGGHHLETFVKSRKAQQADHVSSKSPYTISFPMQVRLCLVRGFQRLRNDLSMFFVTVFGNSIMCLIVSSVFYNLPTDTSSFFSRGALLFYAILLNAFSSALEILTLYEQRPIVEKHTAYALIHPAAEAFASMLTDLPTKILTALASNLILYFMTNLRREAGAFFIFFLVSFTTTLVMSMIFRTIAASSRTLAQAMTPASLFILALVIYTGFTIPTRNMHPWFRWINYLDPIGYGFEALMANEFSSRRYACAQFIPSGPRYANVSGTEHICSVVGGKPGNNFVDGSDYIAQSFQYSRSHLWRNWGILVGFLIFFLITYLAATTYISSAKSKGEVLVFLRGHLRPEKRDDEEGASRGEKKVVVSSSSSSRSSKDAAADLSQRDIFMWRDVVYDIKIKGQPRRLLDHVDGWVQPGKLTALMGASGAGKTTLLDTLASRVTMGIVSGDMLVNGRQRDASFQRKTGYVQQQDLHLQTSTVREALEFSALLRQPAHVSKEEKLQYVEHVIDLLEMREYAGAVVGVPGEGLNVEQRKRLTIGVELAAKPQLLLFLDEPTSGLDSQTAWSVLSLLRKLANHGQAILCTIHQPSAQLFSEFDRLLFLAKGGRTVYFGDLGEDSRKLIDYFERNGADPCPPAANPADWMLQVIGAAPGAVAKRDWPEVWKESPERQNIRAEISKMERELSSRTVEEDAHPQSFAASHFIQYYLVTKRVFQQYWRTPSYIYAKLTLSTVTAAFIGFSFWQAKRDQQGLQNQMFSIFMLMTAFGNMVQQIMPQFVTQRSLYEVRERPSKTFGWPAFMLAQLTVELPWQAFAAVLAFVLIYFPIGLNHNAAFAHETAERGGLFFMLVLAFYIFTSTFSTMIIAGVEEATTGGNIANLMFSLCLIFTGVLATPSQFPHFWIFMYDVSPFRYMLQAMLSVGLAHAPVKCSSIEVKTLDPVPGQTCGQYLQSYISSFGGSVSNPEATSGCEYCSITSTDQFLAQINANYSERWRDWGLLLVYITFNIVGALFLYWLIRVPKGNRVEKSAAPGPDISAQTKKELLQ